MWSRRRGGPPRWLTLVVGGGVVLAAILFARPLHIGGDVLVTGGAGPHTLAENPAAMPWWWIGVVAGMAALGSWCLAHILGSALVSIRRVSGTQRGVSGFLVGTVAAYLAPFLLALGQPMFDRYALALVPLVLMLGVAASVPAVAIARVPVRLAAAMVAVVCLFSAAATHDYLAWNRVRWQLIDAARSRGVEPTDLDGGPEYRGRRGLVPDKPDPTSNQIALAPLPGCQILQSAPVARILATTPAALYLLAHERR
jgi:hypothetical protein